MISSAQKGYSLEEAVSLIEQTILHNNPATKDAVVTIEPRKIVQADEGRYEIDLYVTIDFGKNYKSVFIFECKNWEKAVGKNEIIVLSEKINAVHAQKGFFVARSFSKDALERAKREGRMELLTASVMLDALPLFVDAFQYVQDTILHADIHLNILTNDPNMVGRLDLAKDSKVQFRGENLLLSEFNERVQRMVENEHMNHEPTGTYKEGSYHYDVTKTLKFEPNELFVGGYDCRELTARVQWDTQIIRPKIVSQFDIQSRGQVISFESEQIPGGSIKLPTEVAPPSRPPAEIPPAGPPRRGIPRRAVVTGLVGVAVVGVVGRGFVWLVLDHPFRSVMPSPASRSTPTVESTLPTVPSGTQVLFSDNFQLDPTGQPPGRWKIVAGTWAVGTDVTKVLKQTDTNPSTAKVITVGSTSWTDYRVQAQIKPGSTGWGIAYSLNSRYHDNGNAYSAYSLVLKNGNNWFFGKVVGGIWTIFASGSHNYNMSAWYTLQIDTVGPKISAFLNGSLLHSVTDASLASGNITLRALQAGEFTNVVVTRLG